jgi:hypothetical protein
MNKKANYRVMPEHGFGKTDSFAREPLEARAQGQRLAFDLLRVGFAPRMSRSRELAIIAPGCSSMALS